jgi:SAM-dependent methyltransferase
MTDAFPEGVVPGSAQSRSAHDFDQMYGGTPPWEIGRPQPVFVKLADNGEIHGRVLDAGCGTGEHVLMAASRGLDATGVDAAPSAIAIGQRKASERGLTARLLVWDALRLGDMGERFDTVLDSGLFHVFDDERRARYVEALATVLGPGGRYLMCCFSDRQPGDWGPRRISQDEIRSSFAGNWKVESIEAAEFETTLKPPTAQAWLSRIVRT